MKKKRKVKIRRKTPSHLVRAKVHRDRKKEAKASAKLRPLDLDDLQ